jgi:Tol biopolymer transport system component
MPALSPDGKWIAARSVNEGKGNQHSSADGPQTLILFPTAGGSPKEILQAEERLSGMSWLPDSASILFRDGGKYKMVSIASGEVTAVDYDLGKFRHLAIHPDGRQIAYTTGNHSFEIWALENFLPAPTRQTASQ